MSRDVCHRQEPRGGSNQHLPKSGRESVWEVAIYPAGAFVVGLMLEVCRLAQPWGIFMARDYTEANLLTRRVLARYTIAMLAGRDDLTAQESAWLIEHMAMINKADVLASRGVDRAHPRHG